MDQVLIVDDDEQLLLILTETLKRYRSKFEIITAVDGLAAIKMLQKEKISLVITDIQMPRVNGLVLMSYMARNFPEIPCIVMTAYGTPEMKKRMQQASLHYIEKPFKIPQLAEAILSLLERDDILGGTLEGISISGFLKLIEMEYITCLCEIVSKYGETGHLFFNRGVLNDAVYGEITGEEAALMLLKMDGATINFRNFPKEKIPRRISKNISDLLTAAIGLCPG